MEKISREEKAFDIVKEGNYEKWKDGRYLINKHFCTSTDCDCLDFKMRDIECKHILSVKLIKKLEKEKKDKTLIIENYEDVFEFIDKYGEEVLYQCKHVGMVFEKDCKLIWMGEKVIK